MRRRAIPGLAVDKIPYNLLVNLAIEFSLLSFTPTLENAVKYTIFSLF